MDANEVNKVAGAVLGMLTLAMAIGFAAGGLMSPKMPAKMGYELPDNTASAATAAAPAAEKAEPIAARLAKADVAKGVLPGAVVLISRKGKTAYFESIGMIDPQTKAAASPARRGPSTTGTARFVTTRAWSITSRTE